MSEVARVSTSHFKHDLDLTDRIDTLIRKAKMQQGLCSPFITHRIPRRTKS